MAECAGNLMESVHQQFMAEICPWGFSWQKTNTWPCESCVYYHRCGAKWELARVWFRDDKVGMILWHRVTPSYTTDYLSEFELADPDLIEKVWRVLRRQCWRWYFGSFVVEDLWLWPISWWRWGCVIRH